NSSSIFSFMLSQPLLPAELVKKVTSDKRMQGFADSHVFSQDFHERRLLIRNWEAPYSPEFLIQDLSVGFVGEMKRTDIHLAAFDGDVLAVYETLRWGATADKTDTSGITAIGLAISQLEMWSSRDAQGMRPDGVRMNAADVRREVSRREWVIRILVEQHVELNRLMNGEPLINMLCRSKAWETIALFLAHGATPPKKTHLPIPHSVRPGQIHIHAGTNLCRPPKKCPCWSGKSVQECHAKEAQPYPLAYLCVCGSGRTYRKCCFARKSYVVEKWDPTLKRIMHDYDRSGLPIMQAIRKGNELSQAVAQAIGDKYEIPPFHNPEIKSAQFVKRLAQELLEEGLIDPAFAYALSRVDFAPRPQSRMCSRYLSESRQKRWNALIDEYIATKGDRRSKHMIERAAKIGTWNGALIRMCEGPDCGKFEGAEVETLKLCSKCKISVYCSSSCQKSAWKTHKTECGKDGQHEQSLPSQDSVAQHLKHTSAEVLKQYEAFLAMAPPIEFLNMMNAMRLTP
ncbi:hypothetical protein C8R44DRAFT_627700, partial [Mycena epipterygia]